MHSGLSPPLYPILQPHCRSVRSRRSVPEMSAARDGDAKCVGSFSGRILVPLCVSREAVTPTGVSVWRNLRTHDSARRHGRVHSTRCGSIGSRNGRRGRRGGGPLALGAAALRPRRGGARPSSAWSCPGGRNAARRAASRRHTLMIERLVTLALLAALALPVFLRGPRAPRPLPTLPTPRARRWST